MKNKLFHRKHTYVQASNWAASYEDPYTVYVIMKCLHCKKLIVREIKLQRTIVRNSK